MPEQLQKASLVRERQGKEERERLAESYFLFFLWGRGHGTGDCESVCVPNSDSICEYVSVLLYVSLGENIHVCGGACLCPGHVGLCMCLLVLMSVKYLAVYLCVLYVSFMCCAGDPPFLVSSLLSASAEIVKYLTNGSEGTFLYFVIFCVCVEQKPWLFSTLPALMAVLVRDTCAIPTRQS